MERLRPWYQVVTPREDLRQNKPLDASEFAVNLESIHRGDAHQDYTQPERFFERTFMTKNLASFAGYVLKRLSGIKVETSAVYVMSTRFGGGKTHSLSLLYHLAGAGAGAHKWRGVDQLLKKTGLTAVPHARVAVFVGTEFDPLQGRGSGGDPIRKTPWGEIAWQLGREDAYRHVEEHDRKGVAPGGDAIRSMLGHGPVLVLMDEVLNYSSREHALGNEGQMYHFLHNLSEELRNRANGVLCVSVPKAESETASIRDEKELQSITNMLTRLGKSITIAEGADVTEIIRRRLFEWDDLPPEGFQTAHVYSKWARENRAQLAHLGGDTTEQQFRNSYPFHPSVISVFERKWQSLPRFQRTRGILRMLALWVSHAYRNNQNKAPLLALGNAPLDHTDFQSAVFDQLGTEKLDVPVRVDICGDQRSHAVLLDREARDVIKNSKLHRQVATTIFFESNGGVSQRKAEAGQAEINSAVGGPMVNLADIDTTLDSLGNTCFYLHWERKRFRFGTRPNLNQMLVTRRGTISPTLVRNRSREEIMAQFKMGGPGIDRRYFPERANDVPDRAQLTLVILPPDFELEGKEAWSLMKRFLKEAGQRSRTFKNGLIFCVSDRPEPITDATRDLLVWEEILDDQAMISQIDEQQQLLLQRNIRQTRDAMKESIWRSYRHVVLLNSTGELHPMDIGQITSDRAETLIGLILGYVKDMDHITEKLAPRQLTRYWPPVFQQWSTKKVREAPYSSPYFSRLLNPDRIRETICAGVAQGLFGYGYQEAEGRFVHIKFQEEIQPYDIEISEDYYLIKPEDVQRFQKPPVLTRLELKPEKDYCFVGEEVVLVVTGFDQYDTEMETGALQWKYDGGAIEDGRFKAEKSGTYTLEVKAGNLAVISILEVREPIEEGMETAPESAPSETMVSWSGEVPLQMWTLFYARVLSKLYSEGTDLKVTVNASAKVTGKHIEHVIREIETSLNDLSLDPDELEKN